RLRQNGYSRAMSSYASDPMCRARSSSCAPSRGSEATARSPTGCGTGVIELASRHAGDSTLLEDGDLWNGYDELATPFPNVSRSLRDLFLQIPRQDQYVVRARLADAVGCEDRDMSAGRELALLVRIRVDGEVEKVGSNAAIVQKRVALA